MAAVLAQAVVARVARRVLRPLAVKGRAQPKGVVARAAAAATAMVVAVVATTTAAAVMAVVVAATTAATPSRHPERTWVVSVAVSRNAAPRVSPIRCAPAWI
jgi:hypothetical protein